jgi:RNA polymerase sigma-70 factor (family 1)
MIGTNRLISDYFAESPDECRNEPQSKTIFAQPMRINPLQLLKSPRKGIDKEQFINIFDSYFTPIKNFLYYKCGDVDLAEDLAQETFLRIWEKRDEIIFDTVKPLVYTIAGNLFNNNYQHKQVELKFAKNVNTGSGTSHSPEFEMEMKEFDQKLQTALSRLDEKFRSVFLMNRIDGMTYNEIAESLGLSVKAVEKRMKNALAYLREIIDQKI